MNGGSFVIHMELISAVHSVSVFFKCFVVREPSTKLELCHYQQNPVIKSQIGDRTKMSSLD